MVLDPKTGKEKLKKYEAFHNRMWRADAEEIIFKDPNSILSQIPTSEQYNIYWTQARCFPDKGRKLAEQYMIPWDIDHIGGESQEDGEAKAELVARVMCSTLGIVYEETGVIFSGHGVQLFIKTVNPILHDDYFDSVREHYKFLADKCQIALKKAGLLGDVDTSVFSAGRLMRFPNTLNKKANRPDRYAKVLQAELKPITYDVMEKAGISELKRPEQIHPDTIKKYPKPDTKAVLTGCLFIQHCFTNQDKVHEPEWYAAQSIVARLEDGPKLVHEMSEKHPGYSEHETDLKIDQALKNSGPRTCKDISTRWDGCKNCPHYGTDLTSPILIRGPDYIMTETTGYRDIKIDAEGNPKPGKVNYDDLIKKFGSQGPFVSIAEMHTIFQFNGKFWQEFGQKFSDNWVTGLVKHSPSSAEMSEFWSRLGAHNVRSFAWFNESASRKLNFQNGVLDLITMELSQHSPDYGFTFALPYSYDPRATCPLWNKFMLDIGSPKLSQLLEEFAGYAIAGGDCLAQKALVLYGEGGNGKSVFAETIEQVIGMQNTSNLMIHNLKNDQMRAQLLNKPYNYSDETLDNAFKNPGEFKTLVTGGTTTAKIVYKEPFPFKNKAKFIISTNAMPATNDTSNGLYRRLIIAPFVRRFTGAEDNKMLKRDMWANELAGICNRLIEGYKRLVARGYDFDVPPEVESMSEVFSQDNNTVLRFYQACIVPTGDEEDRVFSREVYQEYVSWIEAQNERPISARVFTNEFRKAGNLGAADPVRIGSELARGWPKLKLNKQGDY